MLSAKSVTCTMGPEHPFVDLNSFLWVVFTANIAYIFLAVFQKVGYGSKTYPAGRHHVDCFSVAVIGIHMLFGGVVIWGGCACWVAMQRFRVPVPAWAAVTLAIAAFGHSATNVFLLRKIPGVRALNVPVYIASTVYNTCRAAWLIDAPESARELLLLWCSVSTFVWMRCFIFTFIAVTRLTGLKDDNDGTKKQLLYGTIYTLSLPYAAVLGVVVPAAALGADARWFTIFACVPVLAPFMIALNKLSFAISAWPCVQNSAPCRWSIQFLLDSTNPEVYHGQQALHRRGADHVKIAPSNSDVAAQCLDPKSLRDPITVVANP